MSLPENEQRQLRKIGQALCGDDPGFVRLMRATDPRVQYGRKLIRALPGVVIGAGLPAAGAVGHRVFLEAAGVMIVLLALVRAVVSWRRYAAVAVARAVVPDALQRQARSSGQPAHGRARHRAQIRTSRGVLPYPRNRFTSPGIKAAPLTFLLTGSCAMMKAVPRRRCVSSARSGSAAAWW